MTSMAENMAETPDIAIPDGLTPESAAQAPFGETDLDLVNALQINPRASWTRIGASLELDATTAARRWQRLTDAGLAWLTAYGMEFAIVGYVRLRCRPEALAALSEQVCASPYIFSVERTSGRYQLQLSVAAEDLAALDDFAVDFLGGLRGVAEVCVSVGLHIYVEGGQWRPQALDPVQRTLLTDGPQPRRGSPFPPPRTRAGDRDLVLALSADGRRSAADLAQDTGLSETTVRRRLVEMTRSGRLLIRCDFAQQSAGWTVNTNFWARLPAGELHALGAELAQWPEIRLCAATTDAGNVLIIAWLRTQHECILLENRLAQSFPNLHITERQLTLRALKRMGRLLSPAGRAVGHVPFAVWPSLVAGRAT